MAKSLRSKWKRKMRSVKREQNGKKELNRLVNMLQNAGELPLPEGEVKMEEARRTSRHTNPIFHKDEGIPYVEPVHTRERRVKYRPERGQGRKSRRDGANNRDSEASEEEEEDEEMDPEGDIKDTSSTRNSQKADQNAPEEEGMAVDKPEHIFSKRTMRDQFGNYPAWMNKRKMLTQQKKNKRIAKRRALSVMGKRRVK